MKQNPIDLPSNYHLLSSTLIELIKEGVMLISQNLQPVYLNQKAREICQFICNSNHHLDSLPPVISDIYHQLSRKFSSQDREFIMDIQLDEEQTIRLRACHLPIRVETEWNLASSHRPWLLVFLEDRNAILKDELRIEQNKYNLTERELQVLNLLSRSYTYQQISENLFISLNTVKFHIKSINTKKRNYSEEQLFYKLVNNNNTTQLGSAYTRVY